MKRLFVGLGLGAMLACSGGKSGGDPVLDQDYASNFTGNWTGPFTVTVSGESQTSTILLPITSSATNRLELGGFCEGSAATAVVTSASTFRIDPRACPPMAVIGCSAVTITYDRGTGSVSSGALTVDASGTMSGCGQKFSYTARLDGATRSTVLLAAGATPAWADSVVAALEAGAR